MNKTFIHHRENSVLPLDRSDIEFNIVKYVLFAVGIIWNTKKNTEQNAEFLVLNMVVYIRNTRH